MNRPLSSTILAVAAIAASASTARADHFGRVAWVSNPDRGFERARAERKPILLCFSASW
jgi:hypothetical protein